MVIHIDPRRINPGAAGIRQKPQQQERTRGEKPRVAPKRMEENFIPEPESLATMIRNAVASLREGLHWDRGTILNLLV